MTTAVETPTETPAETPTPAVTPPVETPATPPVTPAVTDPAKPSETGTVDATAKPPEKYELTLPDDTTFDASDLDGFSAEAKALGLTNEQAQAMVNTRADVVNAIGQTYLADAKADPEIGGQKFDETTRLAVVGRDWLFPPDSEGAKLVMNLFNKTGLGNHKEVLRAFARIGKAKQEDGPVSGQTNAQAPLKRTADVLFPSTAQS